MFFCISAAAIILYHLFQIVTGRMTEDELISIKESEEDMDDKKLEALQHEMERETERLAAASKKP